MNHHEHSDTQHLFEQGRLRQLMHEDHLYRQGLERRQDIAAGGFSIWNTFLGQLFLRTAVSFFVLLTLNSVMINSYRLVASWGPQDGPWIWVNLYSWLIASLFLTIGMWVNLIFLRAVVAWFRTGRIWQAIIRGVTWLFPLALICPIIVLCFLILW